MAYFLKSLGAISLITSIIGILVITWGVILVVFKFLRSGGGEKKKKDVNRLRLTLSLYIMLGLEFMVAGDIIKTVLRPSTHDLIILGSIVTIRTVISYFLTKELKE